VAFWHVRKQFPDGSKDFFCVMPDPRGERDWVKGTPPDAESILFRLPQLLDALSDRRTAAVAWCEGEKDANSVMTEWGILSTSVHTGRSVSDDAVAPWALRADYAGKILVIADNDANGSGLYTAQRRVEILFEAGFSSSQIEVLLPASGNDVTDHIEAGLGLAEMEQMDLAELRVRAPKRAALDALGVYEGETVKPGDVVQASGARRIPDVQESAEVSTSVSAVFGDDPELPEPGEPRPVLPPHTEPLEVAREIMRLEFEDAGIRMLAHWRGSFFWWQAGAWEETPDRTVRVWLYGILGRARLRVTEKVKGSASRVHLMPWCPTSRKVGDVLAALAAESAIADLVEDGSWIEEDARTRCAEMLVKNQQNSQVSPEDARRCGQSLVYRIRDFIPTSAGLLDPVSRSMKNLDPGYFNLSCIPVYSALWENARIIAHPPEWQAFLNLLWPDDPDSISALQEMFGYMLSGETGKQKAFMLVGPPRSGKGTIARILTLLMGSRNVAGPTLASLGQNFGLSSLIGKSLAIISDARFRGRDADQVIERLLSITGEDRIDIDRKNREIWTGQLAARFLLLSNELPYLADASGAVATRFIVLMLQNSWLGQEDEGLMDRLAGELPQILEWSLQGLDRLRERGRFTEPESSADARAQLAELTSPEMVFITDACERGPLEEVTIKAAFAAWTFWCKENGHSASTVQKFGQRLRAALPSLEIKHYEKGKVRSYTGIGLNSEYTKIMEGAGETIKPGEVSNAKSE
jgi:putative DNA primase/helicase